MTFEEIKQLTEFFESKGVLEFEAAGVKVRFGSVKMPQEMTMDPDEQRKKDLEDIRIKLENMNTVSDEETFWSV